MLSANVPLNFRKQQPKRQRSNCEQLAETQCVNQIIWFCVPMSYALKAEEAEAKEVEQQQANWQQRSLSPQIT